MWCIWKRRNEKIWDDVEKNTHISVQLARDYMIQWNAARRQQATPEDSNNNTQIRWLPPMEGEVKCNVDAALFKEQNCFGVGMCLRDSRGHFMKAKTRRFHGVPLPYEAEACGLKEAILWLGDMGMSNVSIELDCKLVVDGILDTYIKQSEFGKIMYDCRMLLSNYPNFKISFVRPETNFVAHSLATASKLYASYYVFDYISSLHLVSLPL